MNRLNCLPLALAMALSAAATPTLSDEPGCLKQVFKRVCLGGPADPALTVDDDGLATVPDSAGDILLEVDNGRITAVSRQLRPATWINFTDVKVKLVRLYSTSTDISDFPLSATSRSSKRNAIRAGRGYAEAHWQRNGWSVSLQWRSLDHLLLRYQLDDAQPGTAETTLEGL